MIDNNPSRKLKITLADYDYQQDIENRLLMSDFSALDLKVLEEILYSSLKISQKKLAITLDVSEKEILPSLDKLAKTKLLNIQNDTIFIDKQMRKYYESQIIRYNDEFKPDMEFLQGLLKKVPIHILPSWYAISKTSNNIFESIIEKHLLTPQLFHRFVSDMRISDPIAGKIIEEVHEAPDCKVFAQDLQKKLSLSREKLEEKILLLEFSFICCLSYNKVDGYWKEVVTPFYEWKEYITFLKENIPLHLPSTKIKKHRLSSFAFIEDITHLLLLAKKRPLQLSKFPSKEFLESYEKEDVKIVKNHLLKALDKLYILELGIKKAGFLHPTKQADNWLKLSSEEKSLYLYRHAHNTPSLCSTYNEKIIKDAEKSISSVLHGNWVYFDDFIKSLILPLSEEKQIKLKKVGKVWKYGLPEYSEKEKDFIKHTLFDWLFEMGITSTGIHENKPCFCVTSFGKKIFEG